MNYSSIGSLFSAIASAIRYKKGTTATIKADNFPSEILALPVGHDTSSVTATATDVLSGKKIVNSSGQEVTGTMANNGAVSVSLVANGSYTIPQGYHNGSGTISQSLTTKGATNYYATESQQTIVTSGTYVTGDQVLKPLSFENLSASNIKNGVNVKVKSGDETIKSIIGTAREGMPYVKYTGQSATGNKTFYFVGGSSVQPYITLAKPNGVVKGVMVSTSGAGFLHTMYDTSCSSHGIVTESNGQGVITNMVIPVGQTNGYFDILSANMIIPLYHGVATYDITIFYE